MRPAMDPDRSEPRARVPRRRRAAAIFSLVGAAAVLVLLVVLLLTSPILVVVTVVALGLVAGALVRVAVFRDHRRPLWAAIGAVGFVVLVVGLVLILLERPLVGVLLAVVAAATIAAGAYAMRGYVRAASAPEVEGIVHDAAHKRSVLFLNPKSGGGKVGEFDLIAEARSRGVQTVELGRDDDLTALAEQAVADGAQILGMAGGDGSQADVAAVAVRHGLPFVCIPAGTRNHFALDLNLDRNDPRIALDAFVEGVEHRVDYGMAGDRFFVNNVSLGIYPHVVQDPAYREGRLKAAASIIPELMSDSTDDIDMRFTSPDGTRFDTAQVLLVSNNPYRGFASVDGAGRRVSLTGGMLGVLVIAAADAEALARATQMMSLGAPIEKVEGFDQWTAPSLLVDSDRGSVLAGVDGEAMELPTPLEIRIVPGGLRVLLPVGTAEAPESLPPLLSVEAIGSLVEIAGGVASGPFGDDA
jgi:diacylglycerol kinase family enzyme